jgi:hypothetical protein
MKVSALAAVIIAILTTGTVGSVVAAVASPAGAPVNEQVTPATADAPLSQLATCVAGRKQLAVVLLMDESASLKETDPGNARVTAAKVAVAGLADLVGRSEEKVKIDTQVAGFGVDIEAGAPWSSLTPSSLQDVNRRIDSFAERNSALDTDYVNALQGALESLRLRSSSIAGPDGDAPCTAVLWFTDGRYSVEDRLTDARRARGRDNRGESQTKAYAPEVDLYVKGGGARAMEQGREVLCRDGGVADQYEATETALLTVPLTTQIEGGDRELLERVVAGPGCGGGNGSGRGAVLPAGNLQDLVTVFDQIVTELGSPAETVVGDPLNACPRDASTCPSGTKTFVVDGAMARFHLLAQVDAADIAVRLTAPGGQTLDIPPAGASSPGQGSVGATPVRWNWISGNALTVDAESSSDATNWAGTWSVSFIDLSGNNPGAPVRARIYLFGDVIPQLVAATAEDDDKVAFRAGDSNDFGVVLTRANGNPVPTESLAGEVTISAAITDPASGDDIDLGPLAAQGDRWVGTYDTPQDLTASSVNLTMRATVTTRSGVALPPTLSTAAVPVRPPVGYPEVVTRSVRIGPISGVEDGVGVIQLRGSPKSGTCVWVEEVRYDPGPVDQTGLNSRVEGAGGSASECLELKEGGSGELVVAFTPAEAYRGIVTGTVLLGTRPLSSDDRRSSEVGLEIQMVKPASAGVAWAIFLALLLLGVGLPLLAFYVSNWMVAKFAPLRLLQGCDVPVGLTNRSVERAVPLPDGRLLHPDDFSNAPFGRNDVSGERVRRFTFSGVPFRSAVSTNPFRPPYGLAGDGLAPTIGSGRGNTINSQGRVALWVTREWVFLPDAVDDAEAPVTGRLIAFVLATDQRNGLDHLESSLRDRLPALLDGAKELRKVAAPALVGIRAGAVDGPGVNPLGTGVADAGQPEFDWGDSVARPGRLHSGADHGGSAPPAPPAAPSPAAPSAPDDDIWND